jgi:hypothetical protein
VQQEAVGRFEDLLKALWLTVFMAYHMVLNFGRGDRAYLLQSELQHAEPMPLCNRLGGLGCSRIVPNQVFTVDKVATVQVNYFFSRNKNSELIQIQHVDHFGCAPVQNKRKSTTRERQLMLQACEIDTRIAN